jgi:hypothetical protein
VAFERLGRGYQEATECADVGHVLKMLHQIDNAVRIARWEVPAAVLPAPAKLVEMRCTTQGFLRTAEDRIETLAVLAAIVEAHMDAHRHHGIFILHPCVALHADFGGKIVYLRLGQGRALKVSDKNVAFQKDMRQDNRDTEFGELG